MGHGCLNMAAGTSNQLANMYLMKSHGMAAYAAFS